MSSERMNRTDTAIKIPVIGKKSKVKSRLVLSFMVSPFEQIGNLGILDSELQLFFLRSILELHLGHIIF